MRTLDLNADLGEGMPHEAELFPLITSANIACGAHAGNESTMRSAVELGLRAGVALGAHPGFEDREHFGRRELAVTPQDVYELVLLQTRRLAGIAQGIGAHITHLKPHGALYNMAARNRPLADAIACAARDVGPALALVGLAGSELVQAGLDAGLNVVSEAFADRAYEPDGSLTPRHRGGAIIESPDAAIQQALRMALEGVVRARDGREIRLKAATVCLHGDHPGAVVLAGRLRAALESAGIRIQTFAV